MTGSVATRMREYEEVSYCIGAVCGVHTAKSERSSNMRSPQYNVSGSGHIVETLQMCSNLPATCARNQKHHAATLALGTTAQESSTWIRPLNRVG